jgi:putative restriction endonuclease
MGLSIDAAYKDTFEEGITMKIYVGITDGDWYEFVKKEKCDEVNFWRPGTSNFRALQPNDMFLFKLHAPDDCIVGGGFFASFSVLPTYLAWDAFGIKNGTNDLDELNERIQKYRAKNNINAENPQIGCIILTEPFYFEKEDWIPVPADWNRAIVQGKTYDTKDPTGRDLYEKVIGKLNRTATTNNGPRYSESLTKHRLGQGGFRISVTDAYKRCCAITGEPTLPVLQAAHIKPYAAEGPHSISNGILLKSDFHTLFDAGYITITTDYCVNVSKRLLDDYGKGTDYYKYNGQKLKILPEKIDERPAKEFLEWHKKNVYLG